MEPEAKIIKVKDLLNNDFQIPVYQRPYKWKEKNVNQLIDDILLHKKEDKSAYRLGTLVIHNDNGKLNIVDGQQRTITLTLISYAIIQERKDLLKKIFINDNESENYFPKPLNLTFTSDITKAYIQNNYKEIKRRIIKFDEETISFFFNRCELVQVILYNISEAFQFFDSQNARGKDLEPHDLLKAFHLREMNNLSTEEEQKKTVEKWETMATDKRRLKELFGLYLYRVRNWSNGYSAKYFTKNDVDVFKGISPEIKEDYPYAKIFRIANYYTEEYNNSVHKKINQNEFDYPFQIDQTIINGKRFFEMIAYYDKMINDIKSIKDDEKILETINSYDGRFRKGDAYIRNLFNCGLLYYKDKFGDKDLPKAIEKIFIWAYSLRLKLTRVGLDSIDNYALGIDHAPLQLFKTIKDAIHPNDILNIKLSTLKETFKENMSNKKTEKIEELFKEMGYL